MAAHILQMQSDREPSTRRRLGWLSGPNSRGDASENRRAAGLGTSDPMPAYGPLLGSTGQTGRAVVERQLCIGENVTHVAGVADEADLIVPPVEAHQVARLWILAILKDR